VEAVEQTVNGLCGVLFGDGAQMGVTGGGCRRGMAEEVLDMAQA